MDGWMDQDRKGKGDQMENEAEHVEVSSAASLSSFFSDGGHPLLD